MSMRIQVKFTSQLRKLAGCMQLELDVDEYPTADQIVAEISKVGNHALQHALVDEAGQPRSSIMVFVDNELVAKDQSLRLSERSDVLVTTLISGG
jgi:molybdopterin converting factor small subunit